MYLIKRALIVCLVLPVFSFRGSAQVYSNKVSSLLAFTGGVTSSNLINDSVKFRSGIMFSAGLSYNLMLNKRLNAGIDVLYTGKAFKYDSPIIKFRYFYLDLPLYVQINLSENVRVNTGVQYSIATNAQVVTLDPSEANGVDIQSTRALKPTDLSVLGGMEFDISKSIAVAARYCLSTSTFLQKHESNFGVFTLSLKYSPIKTYKVFFGKKEQQQ
ncbi:MAG TPA: outer membrane beta-barrel protein [Bacteroidia bacterium]